MLYNKRQFQKSNDKKVLHKVGKQWRIISLAMLIMISGIAFSTYSSKSAKADTLHHGIDFSNQILKNRINSSLETNSVKNQGRNNNNLEKSQNTIHSINQKANQLHNRILINATQNTNSDNENNNKQRNNNLQTVSSQYDSNPNTNNDIKANNSVPKFKTINNNNSVGMSTSGVISDNDKKNILSINMSDHDNNGNGFFRGLNYRYNKQQKLFDLNDGLLDLDNQDDINKLHNLIPRDTATIQVSNSVRLSKRTTSLSGLFSNLPNLQTVIISNITPNPQLKNLSNLFANDSNLDEINVSGSTPNALDYIDFSDISDISGIFKGDSSFNGFNRLPKRLNFRNLKRSTNAFNNVKEGIFDYYKDNGNQTSNIMESLSDFNNLRGTKWLLSNGIVNHLRLHDIYNDDTPSINPLVSKDIASNQNTVKISNSDLPEGWTIVDKNGNPISSISKSMKSSGSDLDINVAPYYDGLTFTNKKVIMPNKAIRYQLEFKKGTLTGWNGLSEPISNLLSNDSTPYNPTTFLGDYIDAVTENSDGSSNAMDLYYSDAPINVDADDIKDIKFDSDVNILPVSNMNCMFYNLINVSDIDFGKNFKTTQVNSMNNMFNNDISLTQLNNFDDFNTMNVISFYRMFRNTALHSLILPKNFSTQNAIYLTDMFCENKFLTNIDFSKDSKFNTNKVRYMNGMFNDNPVLNHLSLPNTFYTNNVINMSDMFRSDYDLSDLNIVKPDFKGNFFNTSNVENMAYMFAATNLSNITLPKTFNTNNVNNMMYMFAQKLSVDGANAKILKTIYFPSDFTTKYLSKIIYKIIPSGFTYRKVPTTRNGATGMFSVISDSIGTHNWTVPNSDLHINNNSNNLIFNNASDVGLPNDWVKDKSIDYNPTWKKGHYNNDVKQIKQLPIGSWMPVALIHFQDDLLLSDNSDVEMMYLPTFQSKQSWIINAPNGTSFNSNHTDSYTLMNNNKVVKLMTGTQNDCSYLFELPVLVKSAPIIVDYVSNNENFVPQYVYNSNFNPNAPISSSNEQFEPNSKFFKISNPHFNPNKPQSKSNSPYLPNPDLFPKYKDGKLNPDYEHFFSNSNSLIYKKILQGKYNTPIDIFSKQNTKGLNQIDFNHSDSHKDYKVDSDYNKNLYQYYVFFKSKPQIITVPIEGKYATTGDNQVIINLYTQDNTEGKNRQLNRVIETSLPGYIGTYRSLDPNDYLVQLHKTPSKVINSSGATMSDATNKYNIDNSSKPQYFFMHGDNNGGVDLYLNPTTKCSDDPPIVNFYYDRSTNYSSDVKGINVRYLNKNNQLISSGFIKPASSDFGRSINVTNDNNRLTNANTNNTGIGIPMGYHISPNQDVTYAFTNNQQTANIYVEGNISKQPVTIKINQYMRNRFNQIDTNFNQDGFINGEKSYNIKEDIYDQVGNTKQLSQNEFYPKINQEYYDVPDINTQIYLIRYIDNSNIIYNQNDNIIDNNLVNFNYNIYKKSNSFRKNTVHYVSYSDVNHGNLTNYISTLSDRGNTNDNFDYGNDDRYYRENVPRGYQFYKVLSLNDDKNPNSDYVKGGLQDFRESDQNETIEVIPNAQPITFNYVTPNNQVKKSITISGEYDNPKVAIDGEQGYTSKYDTQVDNKIIDRQAKNGIQYRNSLGVPFGFHISKETQSPTFTTKPQTINVMIAGNPDADIDYITIKEENKNNSDIKNTFTVPNQIKGNVGDNIDLIASNYTPNGYKVDTNSGKIKDGSRYDIRNGDQTVHTYITPIGQLNQKNVTFYYKDVSTIPSSITLEYINQNGKKVGYSDTLYGNLGQNFNLTNPSDGGEPIPNGYTLNGAYSTTKGHNSDSDLVGKYQNTILPIQNQPRTVVLDVTGKKQITNVKVNRIVKNSDGCNKVLPSDNISLQALNGNSDILKPSDYNPNSNKYTTDYSQDSNQNIQINNNTATPNSVTFYYDSKTLKGAPAVVRYINQNTGQEVSDPYVFNGNVNQSFNITNHYPVPIGYNLSSNQNTHLILTDSPQTIDLYIQGQMIHSDIFNIHVIKEDASSNLIGKINTVPVSISGHIGDQIIVNPYNFGTNNDIKSINGSKNNKYTLPNGFHATSEDTDIKLNINSAENLTPVKDIPYIYQQNPVKFAVGNIKVHYITNDKNATSDHKKVPNVFSGYRELDVESDAGFIGKSKFDLTPYTHDIPEVLKTGYNVSQVVNNNNQTIPTNNYQWTIDKPQQDIYVKVQNNHNSPIILF